MRRAATSVLLVSALLLPGCGGGDDADSDVAAPSAKPSPSADPKGDWLSSLIGLCTALSGAVSGAELQAGGDGKITPGEVLAGEKAARPAVDAFDKGLAALPVPPEAAEADAVLQDFLARSKPTVVDMLAAAQAGDQAALNAVLSEREKLRLEGYQALYAVGVPEKCTQRGTYS